MKIGKISLLKNINNEAVWQLLSKQYGQMSITELSKTTGLSFPTVNRVIECGLANGLVTEGEILDSTLGRRPQMYKLNKDFADILCILLDNGVLYFELKDFCENTLMKGKAACIHENVTDDIAELINNTARSAGKITLAALSISGIVDGSVILRSYRYPYLNGADISKILLEKSGIRVILENDMRILGYAAKKTVSGIEQKTVSVIQYGHSGIGCCNIINGKILRGLGGFAGEVGFLPFGDRNLNEYDIYEKIIEAVISVAAPHAIIIYNDNKKISVSGIVRRVKEFIPPFAFPEIISAQDFYKDEMYGLFYMGRSRLMKEVSV